MTAMMIGAAATRTARTAAPSQTTQTTPPPSGGSNTPNPPNPPARPATVTFQPATASATTTTIELPLGLHGAVRRPIVGTGGTATSTVVATVTGLQDGSGAPVEGTLFLPDGKQANVPMTAETGVLPLELRLPRVPPAGSVTGLLTIAGHPT